MCIENKLANVLNENVGKLLLRVSLGALMLFHGVKKFNSGVEGMKGLISSAGFPEALVYGTYVGEILVPILLIVGLMTRVSALVYSFTMAFAIYLVHANDIFIINAKTGGLVIELPLLYLLSALALAFLGAGKYSLDAKMAQCSCSKKASC